MTENLETVVAGILDVLDRVDHKDWQGEPIQDLRNSLEVSPTPALPPDDKRCVLVSNDDPSRRCRNPRRESSRGTLLNVCNGGHAQCNFGPAPESKPAISERNQAALDLLDQAVRDDDDTVDPNATVDAKPTPALPPGDKDRCDVVSEFNHRRCLNHKKGSITCLRHHNFGPDPESKPVICLCHVQGCETPRAPGKVYCHEHYGELFNKPAPKPLPSIHELGILSEGKTARLDIFVSGVPI